MKRPSDIDKANKLAFGAALVVFALPLCISSYLAFGRGLLVPEVLDNTVVNALTLYGPTSWAPAIIVVRSVIIAHLVLALPIIATPIALRLELGILKDQSRVGVRGVKQFLIRLVLILCFALVAILVPYFEPLMSIVSDISVVSVIYILPVTKHS